MKKLKVLLRVIALICIGVAVSYPIRYQLALKSNNEELEELSDIRRRVQSEEGVSRVDGAQDDDAYYDDFYDDEYAWYEPGDEAGQADAAAGQGEAVPPETTVEAEQREAVPPEVTVREEQWETVPPEAAVGVEQQ